MIKDSMLYRVLIRFLKEKHMFHLYRKCIGNDYFEIIDSTYYHYTSSILTLFAFRNKNNTSDQITLNTNIFWSYINVNEFNRILTLMFKEDFIKFMEENSLINVFASNLLNSKNFSMLNLDFGNKINLKKQESKYKIINIYLDAFIDNGYCILEILYKAFSWAQTKEGYPYWADANSLYLNFIWNKMLIDK